MPKAEITSYAIVDLLSWQESGSLRISPSFQRRSVWATAAKGHFIDSVLLDYPIPPVHIRLTTDEGGRTVREVIDGQQRMRAVFDFIEGRFRIPHAVSQSWGGLAFDQLDDDLREKLRLFSFTVYQYKKLTDPEVLDIFSRLNTYSVSLSAQELRNGKWFGAFKQTSYGLAAESLEFWRRHRIFTEQQIARMREAELVSELLVAQMDGLQDKKSSLDAYYENLDDAWAANVEPWLTGRPPNRRSVPAVLLDSKESKKRFQATIARIDASVGDVLSESPLRRPALFHSLYCAVYHLEYGLPRLEHPTAASTGVSAAVRSALRQTISTLTDLFESKGRTRDENLASFYEASARQTDNVGPRVARTIALLDLINSAG